MKALTTNSIISVLLLLLLQSFSPVHSRDRRRSRGSSRADTWNLSSYSFLPRQCGEDLSQRIHGGEEADLFEFPWLVLLEYRHPSRRQVSLSCGGALISERYVLTAAHCTADERGQRKPDLVSVRLGEYDKRTPIDCINYGRTRKFCADSPLSIEIQQVIVHEDYNIGSTSTYPNDISLLRLSRDVSFTSYIQPICLPEDARITEEYLHVGGWGRTEDGSLSDVKLKVKLPLVTDNRCSGTERQMCAGGQLGRDSCSGDSGGPLMSVKMNNNGKFRWTAVGIVSFGPDPCGQKDRPGTYTRVSSYMRWILSNMRA